MKNTFILKYLTWTGRNVTLIYVIQWLIIGNVATAIFQTQDSLQSELWVIGIIACSSLISLAYLKIKAFKKAKRESLI